MIIVAFDFRTKCAVTDRIETAYIVDDLQLLLFEPNVTCMQGLEIHAYISNQGIRSGGGLNSLGNWVRLIGFVQPGNSVRGTVFPRELGPEGTVFPKGIRSAGPKIGPDRIPYDTGIYIPFLHQCDNDSKKASTISIQNLHLYIHIHKVDSLKYMHTWLAELSGGRMRNVRSKVMYITMAYMVWPKYWHSLASVPWITSPLGLFRVYSILSCERSGECRI